MKEAERFDRQKERLDTLLCSQTLAPRDTLTCVGVTKEQRLTWTSPSLQTWSQRVT